jgi:hypothetical protein
MNARKTKISGFIIFILLALTILSSCGGNDIQSKKALNNFSKLIEEENFDDLSLTIYYMSPFAATRYPWSAEDLINRREENKIVINGSRLEEHIDLLNQINNNVLTPVEHKFRISAWLHYVFETKKDGKLFSVSMWGEDNSIFVNGIEIKGNEIFYDIVMPFLPTDVVKEFETYLNGIK